MTHSKRSARFGQTREVQEQLAPNGSIPSPLSPDMLLETQCRRNHCPQSVLLNNLLSVGLFLILRWCISRAHMHWDRLQIPVLQIPVDQNPHQNIITLETMPRQSRHTPSCTRTEHGALQQNLFWYHRLHIHTNPCWIAELSILHPAAVLLLSHLRITLMSDAIGILIFLSMTLQHAGRRMSHAIDILIVENDNTAQRCCA